MRFFYLFFLEIGSVSSSLKKIYISGDVLEHLQHFLIAILINEDDFVIGSFHSLILFNMQASFSCNKHKKWLLLFWKIIQILPQGNYILLYL